MQTILQEILSRDISFTPDARELLNDCCIEFINLLTFEANEILEKRSRKVINQNHMIKARKDLGFEEYIEPVKAVIKEFDEPEIVSYPSIR